MLLKIYTKIHNYIWIKTFDYVKRSWEISGKPPKLLLLFCYFPFPSEFQKKEEE
jgi:hypothetical protein